MFFSYFAVKQRLGDKIGKDSETPNLGKVCVGSVFWGKYFPCHYIFWKTLAQLNSRAFKCYKPFFFLEEKSINFTFFEKYSPGSPFLYLEFDRNARSVKELTFLSFFAFFTFPKQSLFSDSAVKKKKILNSKVYSCDVFP
jgi:hypothetical protein